ncbi:hypothetical protein HK096_010208 [Nowakowskiella sp. JEL0078]|nr:hypothetical protein HK096_010208 [Nowakowskiella sp. JEL0078]
MSTIQEINQEYMNVVSLEFNNLKGQTGHFSEHQGDFNPDIDSINGKKHKAMKILAGYLGEAGTKFHEIIKFMGQPDMTIPISVSVSSIEENVDILGLFNSSALQMPGPILGGSIGTSPEIDVLEEETFIVVYFWRWRHDYLWFYIDGGKGVVITSNWYHA